MKIENGVLYYYDKNDDTWQAKLTKSGFLRIDTTIGKEDAATLARYLLEFSRSGELREPTIAGCGCERPEESEPTPKCEQQPTLNDGPSAVLCSCKQTEPAITDEQQLARETMEFWERVYLSILPLPGFHTDTAAVCADNATGKWLKARERYGVK